MITNYAPNYAVEPPLFYLDEQGKECEFNTLEEGVKEQTISLLQCASTEALLSKIPTFAIVNCESTTLKILNFTDYILGFNGKRELIANKGTVLARYINKSCLLIAYPIKNMSSYLICVESKDDDKPEIRRSLIVDVENLALSVVRDRFPGLECPKSVEENLACCHISDLEKEFEIIKTPVVLQHSVKIVNKEELIKKEADADLLIRQIPESASFKQNPTWAHYVSRTTLKTATIINHTEFKIEFDIEEALRIQGIWFVDLSFNNSVYVAYQSGEEKVICFEQKISGVKEIGRRFFCSSEVGYTETLDKPEILEGEPKLEKAFKVFSLLHCDPKSFFAENNIPKEIKNEVMKHYIFS